MKIKKFSSIKNIGSFREFEWNSFCSHKKKDGSLENAEIWKKNIFFGDNGNWKSTIVKILKSLNEWTNILPKNWDMMKKEQEVKITMDWGGDIEFSNTGWNSSDIKWKIHTFDKDFIRDNVGDLHDETENDTSKKRWNQFFTLWEFTEKERKLANLTQEKNEINKLLVSKDIMEMYGSFDAYSNNLERDTKKKELENNLKTEQEKKQNLTIRKSNLLQIKNITLPSISSFDEKKFCVDFEVFWEKLSSIDFGFWWESAIKEIILSIHKNSSKKCLVCDQSIKDNGVYISRISLLINHFTGQSIEEKEKFMNEKLENIHKSLGRIKDFKNELLIFSSTYQEKIGLLKLYGDTSSYIDISSVGFSLSEGEAQLIDSILNKVSEKQKAKSSIITSDLPAISKILETFQNALGELAKYTIENNKLLEWVKSQHLSSIETDIKVTEEKIAKCNLWISFINNYERIAFFISSCKDFYIEENGNETDWTLKACLSDLRTIINDKFNAFTEEYGVLIKDNITDINSSISVDFDCKLNGGISHGSARCGFRISYNWESIARDLSDGEKRVVALSYFFALAQKRHNKSWILVFDDPVTDFDAWHKQIIASKVSELAKDYEQTIVFTHDEKFFEYVSKQNFDFRFSIQKIHKWSIIGCIWKEQRELYEKDLEDFYLNGLSSDEYFRIRELIYKLRYCMESRIKNDGLLHNEERFDRILDKLEKMPTWTKEQVKILKEMYSFCNMNGSHEWSCEWYNGLKKNIEWYRDLWYYILPSIPL